MGAIVFASTGGRKYHFDKDCKAFQSAQMLSDWDCEEFCSHLHPTPRALKRMSASKAATEGKLPCLACVPAHLRELPGTETFGHERFEYDGVPICARCFIHHRSYLEAVAWPCTSAIVLGLTSRPCPRCKGNGGDPDDLGDWVPEVGRYDPNTVGPCPECHGNGRAAVGER